MITKICKICSKSFQTKPYRATKAKFCSFKCHGLSMNGHEPWNKGIKYNKELKSKLNLEGLELGRINHEWKKGKHFSPDTEFKKGHHLNKGEKSYLWKGGITPQNKLLRHSMEFKLWREAVFKRDDYTCQECEVKGGELHPHHIKQFALWPELRFAIDNGITLCKTCHMKTDTWGRNVSKLKVVAQNN